MGHQLKPIVLNEKVKKALRWVKERGLECVIHNKKVEGTFWVPNNAEIGIKKTYLTEVDQINHVLSNIFHEYAHYYQHFCGQWKKYLAVDPSIRTHSSTLRAYMCTALRCEKHAEKLAVRFMKEVFPDDDEVIYMESYNDKELVEKWKKEFLDDARVILKYRRLKSRGSKE